jgi:hypothetical protein
MQQMNETNGIAMNPSKFNDYEYDEDGPISKSFCSPGKQLGTFNTNSNFLNSKSKYIPKI